jgi:hypothetical protein
MLGLSVLESVIFIILLTPLMIMMAGIVLLPLFIIYLAGKDFFSNDLYFRHRKEHII